MVSYIKYTLPLIIYIFISSHLFAQSASYLKKIIPNLSTESTQTKNSKLNPNSIKKTIANIVVKGNKSISSEDIISSSKLGNQNNITDIYIKRAKKNIKNIGVFKKVNIIYSDTSHEITIFVEENPLVTSVIVNGNTTYAKAYINEFLSSKANEPVNLKHIRKDIKFLESIYEKDGYFEAKVFNIKKPEKEPGPLIFNIAEGVIEDIEITGNIKTKDYVIIREMDLRAGDILNEKTLKSDLRKVYNLNYFEQVIPEFLPGELPYTYKLKLSIKERETSGAFTFGGGYSPEQGFNIFSDLYWDNLLGTGQLVMIKGNFGIGSDNASNTYQIKYKNPWAFGKNKSFGVRVWSRIGSFRAFNLVTTEYNFKNSERQGIDFEFGFPYSYDLRTSHKIKYENVKLPDENVNYDLYTYTFAFTHDKRDEKMNPTSGYYNNFNIEHAFKLGNESLDLTRFNLSLRRYIPTFEKQTIFLKTTFGHILSSEINNETIFVDEYYYVGGSRSVRGYKENEPFAYGETQVIGTLEYRYIFNTKFTSYLFLDAGYGSKLRQSDGSFKSVNINDLNSFKLTKGIGIKFILQPLGPIKLDFGITEKGVGRLQFNLGYNF